MIKWLVLLFIVLSTSAVLSAQTTKTAQDLADPDGRFLDLQGTSIYVQARGLPENPAVILIHGFGGSTFTWRDTLDPLVEAGYYAVALDLPPFGLSDKSADMDYSRSALADVVVSVMDELNIESAVIVGHSMGGEVTAYFAIHHPDRVKGLVFVDGGVFAAMPASENTSSGGGLSDLSGFMETLDPKSPLASILVRTFLTPERFTELLTSAYGRKEVITDDVIVGYQRPLLIEEWPQGFLAFSTAVETDPITLDDLTAAVDENDLPVLIVWGESDTWVSIGLGETMNAALTDSQMVTYDEVGHLPMEEEPKRFTADLIAFLEGIEE